MKHRVHNSKCARETVKKQNATKTGVYFGSTLFLFGLILAHFWKDLVLTIFCTGANSLWNVGPTCWTSERIDYCIIYSYAKISVQMVLQPGTLAYHRWKGVGYPMKTSFYFWNWTNPEQITNKSVKPHFVEMGPYVFWQTREKVDLKYNSENGTITYRDKFFFNFDPELTNGSLSDKVTSVNAIAAVMAHLSKSWGRFSLYMISMLLRSTGQNIWWTKSVGELLFEGFENPITNIGTYVPGLEAPDKFGYFYGYNNTPQPRIVNIDAGKNSLDNIGKIYFINSKNESNVYPKCKGFQISNAEFFAPNVTPDRVLKFYVPEVCRKIFHYYTGESTYAGMKTYVFGPTKRSFDNGSEVPEMKCYYEDGDNLPIGMLDISKCRTDAPIGFSMPHFWDADPVYGNMIDGMKPEEKKHLYWEALEPTTGIQVNMSVKIQINVRLTRNRHISLFSNVPDIYIPVLWQETEMLLDGMYFHALRCLVLSLQYGTQIWYGVSASGLVTAIFVTLSHWNLLKCIKKNLKNERLENSKKAEEEKLTIIDENEKESIKYVIAQVKDVTVVD